MTEYDLKSFRLENYKSIKESPDIDLGGLALILGPNSSGKTNILESLILLKQSLDQGDISLTLNGDYIELGEYRDVVHMKDTSHRIGYKFIFQRDSTSGDEDVEYECPICNKEYVRYEGHYTNHLADEHPQFWASCGSTYGEEIKRYEDFLVSETSIEIFFKYNQNVKSNIFDELKITNPSPQFGLFLSSVNLKATESGYTVTCEDIDNREILELSVKGEELDTEYPDDISDLVRMIKGIIYLYAKGYDNDDEDRLPWRYRYQLTESGDDDVFPDIYQYSEGINNIYDEIYETKEKSDPNYKNEVQDIAAGLLGRFSSIVSEQLDPLRILNGSLDEMVHIGPLRRNPQRLYFGSGRRPGQLYSQGENIEDMIFKAQQSGESQLIEKTNQWLSECGFDVQLGISEVGYGDLYQLVVKEDGLSINLTDSGFGLSQILPIIVRAVNMDLKKKQENNNSSQSGWVPTNLRRTQSKFIMLIEQPEIHLNPRIEASIGDFFINIIENDIDMIIETHSEHLLNRIQRRVADDTIENDDRVSIYFVSKPNKESEIEEIIMDSEGRFENWPAGFFQEDFEEAVEILKESLPDSEKL